MRKYREYTDDQVIEYAKLVTSIAGLLRMLGLKCVGGNYAHMHKTLGRLNIDVSHWKKQPWNKGQKLKDWKDYSRIEILKPHLIVHRGHRCELCRNETWMGKPIPLECHHVDGDRTNNELDNLKLLCCNCHALTDSWRKPKNGSMA